MGYETRMYLVESHSSFAEHDDGLAYGSVVAVLNLCKCGDGPFHDYRNSCLELQDNKPTHYVYADDGNTKIIDDRYDDPLVEMDAKEALEAMKLQVNADTAAGERPYRRFLMAIDLLERFVEDFTTECETCQAKVLTYGY
jgi:hypothetical protein